MLVFLIYMVMTMIRNYYNKYLQGWTTTEIEQIIQEITDLRLNKLVCNLDSNKGVERSMVVPWALNLSKSAWALRDHSLSAQTLFWILWFLTFSSLLYSLFTGSNINKMFLMENRTGTDRLISLIMIKRRKSSRFSKENIWEKRIQIVITVVKPHTHLNLNKLWSIIETTKNQQTDQEQLERSSGWLWALNPLSDFLIFVKKEGFWMILRTTNVWYESLRSTRTTVSHLDMRLWKILGLDCHKIVNLSSCK